MTKLYLIHGFIGAGKTTFSRKLAQDTNALLLNADARCGADFTPEQLSTSWDDCFAQAVRMLWEEAQAHLRNGRDVILDFGFWDRASRDVARKHAANCLATVVHYYVSAPDTVLLARLKQRQGPIAERNLQHFKSLRMYFEPPAADEACVLISGF